MQYTTYSESLQQYNVKPGDLRVSNTMVILMKFIKTIITKYNRGKGYLNHISTDRDPKITLDVLSVLYDILKDNEIFMDENLISNCQLLQEYLFLVIENKDNVIRDNPNILYDDVECENPKINCNMIDEIFKLISAISNDI